MPEDTYDLLAKYYDEGYASREDVKDLPFYRELAKRQGAPVLEIACGTGRILLPIARAGIEIRGVDNSGPMLHTLKKKLKKESQQVQNLVSVHPGDMRSFDLGRKYELVTIPFRSIQHMYSTADQIAVLCTAKKHLAPQGRLVFDVFYPRFDMLASGIGDENQDLEWESKTERGKTIRRYFIRETHDKIRQVFTGSFIFRTFEGQRMVREECTNLKMAYYTYPHLLVLFEIAGLEIVEEYGSFDKAPLDNDASDMIFVLKGK
ncbi:class I SAM-dependent methyltransferase [Planctomycetota bacterium]